MDSGGGEGADAGASASGEAAEASVKSATATAEAKPEVDPDDFDAVQPETVDSLGRKRVNSIPHPRVKTMIEKATKKQIAAVAKELGITKAEAEIALDDVLGAVREKNTKFGEYETYFSSIRELEDEMQNRTEEFIRRAAGVNPNWKKIADLLDGQGQPAKAQAVPAAEDDPRPEPDYPVRDAEGKEIGRSYTAEGLEKRLAWERRQATREAEAKLGDRLKPIEERYKNETDREREARIQADIDAKLTQQLDRAKKWHGFEDNAADILKALQGDKTISLHDAYVQVVMPKLAADRQKMREELLAEQNAQPRSTSATTTATATKPTDGPRDTASIAREVLREFGG